MLASAEFRGAQKDKADNEAEKVLARKVCNKKPFSTDNSESVLDNKVHVAEDWCRGPCSNAEVSDSHLLMTQSGVFVKAPNC